MEHGHDDYFERLQGILKGAGIGRPVPVLDLDRVDHNIDRICQALPSPLHYRVVTKSLPSRELLRYVMNRAGTSRLMAFHQPFLEWMIRELPGELPDLDIMLGKPLLTASLAEFHDGLEPALREDAFERIQWLADTPERLLEQLAFAQDRSLCLRIAIEIDIGLDRGGAITTADLDGLLALIRQHPSNLRLSGLMGYDAHVPYTRRPVLEKFGRTMATYAGFVDHLRQSWPDLWHEDLCFNSGGSTTFGLFAQLPSEAMPVNDVATGSAVVRPSTFGTLHDHLPALHLAAPVLRKFRSRFRRDDSPFGELSLYLYGGGWAAEVASPGAVELNSLTSDPPNQNLLPNQSLYHGPADVELAIGDFVFFHPHQGDAISQFENIVVVRGDELVGIWGGFPRRF